MGQVGISKDIPTIDDNLNLLIDINPPKVHFMYHQIGSSDHPHDSSPYIRSYKNNNRINTPTDKLNNLTSSKVNHSKKQPNDLTSSKANHSIKQPNSLKPLKT